jgi:hypothetical protein
MNNELTQMTTEFINLENAFCCNAISQEIIKILPVYQMEAQRELGKLNPSIWVHAVLLNAPQS